MLPPSLNGQYWHLFNKKSEINHRNSPPHKMKILKISTYSIFIYTRLKTFASRKMSGFCALNGVYSDATNFLFSTGKRIKSVICRHCSGQCNRPACDYDDYQGQNHVSELYFCKKTLDKAKIYSENSDNECQECCDNH